MVKNKKVTSVQGEEIPIQADTICIHGDSTHGISIVKEVTSTLLQSTITIRNFMEKI